MNSQLISRGFITAGLMNSSVLIFSRLFTNTTIPEFDSAVMSNFGLLMIVIWGLAYISVAKTYYRVKWLVVVFAIEKLIYGIVWMRWMLNNEISKVFEEDIMAGMFYSTYGVNDWIFCVFFSIVSLKLFKSQEDIES